MLRGRRDRYHRVGFLIAFTVGAVAIPIQMGVGDSLARWVYNNQPVKFAAIELVPETASDVPETLLGHLNDDGTVSGGIRIPGLASWLSDPSTAPAPSIQGLDTVPADERPTDSRRSTRSTSPGTSWSGSAPCCSCCRSGTGCAGCSAGTCPGASGSFASPRAPAWPPIICMEAGWVVSEVGRQPWIVYNLMKVEDAATANTGVWITFVARDRAVPRTRRHHGAHPAQHEPTVPRAGRGRAGRALRPAWSGRYGGAVT